MIDEARHDLAIEYVLGSLAGEAGREFEAWIESDGELQALVDELQESTAALAHTVPWQTPPPELREKVLATIRGESMGAAPRRGRAWLPWSIAAALAIGCVLLFLEHTRLQSTARDDAARLAQATETAQIAKRQTSGLTGRLELADVQAKIHTAQIAELQEEITKLRGRDAFAQMQIATLTAQVAAFAKAGVTIVWDPEKKRGVIKASNLPTPAEGKSYQLWVIDPGKPAPVSAGVLPVTAAGSTRVSFEPESAVDNAGDFAISIEPAGGMKQPSGPIILAGN